MLAQPNDFAYAHGGYDHHHGQHSDERPKLFLDPHHGGPHAMHGGMHHPGMGEYQHMVGGHAAMTQHQQQQQHQHLHHQGGDFDHEPLMMNMHNPQSHFYPPMGGQMLHVSADYPSSMDGTTPSARGGNSKRSREDLNLKEKKRMFKLNDRINSLKDLLDEAGVQSKKNKQSILDNTFHYVSMLRSNLLIAKQKAERAEKQAELFRSQAQKGGVLSDGDQVFKQCFLQSSTPRVLVDLNMEPVAFNAAFLHYSGLTEDAVKSTTHALRSALCLDNLKLDAMLQNARDGKPASAVVQARNANGVASLTLMVSAMTDDMGKVANVEFSLIPLEISSQPSSYGVAVKNDSQQEASPSSVNELAL